MADAPVTTIPPFTNTAVLPACAVSCGPLYDANGGCVPPAISTAAASVYTSCFCANSEVAPFSTGSTGVCDSACTADSEGLSSIASWFRSICNVNEDAANVVSSSSTTSSSASAGATGTDSEKSSSGSSGGGGGWLSSHWQWVIFLVVIVVAIAGIWIGACIWRRRYLRKKDRQTSLGQKQSGSASRPSWGPGMSNSASELGQVGVADPSAYDSQRNSNQPMMPTTASGILSEKPAKKPKEKKRWVVKERT